MSMSMSQSRKQTDPFKEKQQRVSAVFYIIGQTTNHNISFGGEGADSELDAL